VNATGRIVYCHCAYWAALPAETKQAVLAGLTDSGVALEAVADLCGLAARRDPALGRWAETPGLQIIACHPRAIRWLFAYAGAPLPAETVIHNMRLESAGAILARLACGERPGGRSPAPLQAPPPGPPGDWVPWFPVIDYDRCQGCQQCFEFCLFGVYTVDGGTVRVAQPDHCKTACPACARLCPHSAIIFPKYKDGPISGDTGELAGVAEDGLKADLAGLTPAQVRTLLRRRSAARARAAAGGEKPKEPPAP
jgi:NAD-dependent dihydropyrimidine dehydrogenase PreA subunit